MIFKMEITPHTPTGKQNVCRECVLQAGEFMCLDRSYCKVNETGRTWKKSKNPLKSIVEDEQLPYGYIPPDTEVGGFIPDED